MDGYGEMVGVRLTLWVWIVRFLRGMDVERFDRGFSIRWLGEKEVVAYSGYKGRAEVLLSTRPYSRSHGDSTHRVVVARRTRVAEREDRLDGSGRPGICG